MLIGVIGPTNMRKLSELTKKPEEELLSRATQVGQTIAALGQELLINADKGMLLAVAKGFMEVAKDKARLHVLVPKSDAYWEIAHAKEVRREMGGTLETRENWDETNHAVVFDPCITVCVGRSTGTFKEFSDAKYDFLVPAKGVHTNLRRIIAIRELLYSGHLPPEIQWDLEEARKLLYIPTVEDLKAALQEAIPLCGPPK